MRAKVVGAPCEIGLVRAREMTNAIKNNPDLPRAIQLATGLKETFGKIPISIAENERLVGRLTEKFKGALLYPEVRSEFYLDELDNFSEREFMRFAITEDEKQQLREEILAYWKGNGAYEQCCSQLSEDVDMLVRNLACVIQNDFAGGAPLADVNYRKVLKLGYEGIVKEAAKALAGLREGDPETDRKKTFYESVVICAEAVITFAERYSRLAAEMAESAVSEERARELREIAEVTSQVPAKPAHTFREALQSFWFTYLALMQLDYSPEIPVCRLDQYLYPYYKRDMKDGALSPEAAAELIGELFIKFEQLVHLHPYATTMGVAGNPMRPTTTVGGVDENGNDVTNELSFMILDVFEKGKLVRPNITVRLHKDSPESFVRDVVRIMTNGTNVIAVFNDEVIIPAFTRAGASIESAREYSVTGCVEPVNTDMYGPNCSAYINAPKALEMLLNGGKPILSMTGDSDDLPSPAYKSYEEFWEAFKVQFKSVIDDVIGALYVVGETQERLLPNPMLSMLVGGTLESGKDVKSGGARYNFIGLSLVGLATLVDSLAAIREVVYVSKQHSLEEVVKWLKADFVGYELERQMLLNQIPKFGNGDPEVDKIAADFVDYIDDILKTYRSYRSGSFMLGMHTETQHVSAGMFVAATPDGRRSGEMLSCSAGPTSGMDREGPTAALASMATVDYTKVGSGASCNMRFSPDIFRTDESIGQFISILKTYFFKLGGQHLQINVTDTETLRDAQQHPEKYQDLIVRVAGYCARFVELAPPVQEEIIARTEMCGCQ